MHCFVEEMTMPELVLAYKNVAGKEVKKFETLRAGRKRVAAAICTKYDATLASNGNVIYAPPGMRWDNEQMAFVDKNVAAEVAPTVALSNVEPTPEDEAAVDPNTTVAEQPVEVKTVPGTTRVAEGATISPKRQPGTFKLDGQTYQVLVTTDPKFRAGSLRAKAWAAISGGATHGGTRGLDARFTGILSWFVRAGYARRIETDAE